MRSSTNSRIVFVFTCLLIFSTSIYASDYLVSYDLVKSHTTSSLKELWKKNKIPRLIMPVNNDVDIYEVIYKVKWIDSTWRTASGICYMPKNIKKASPYVMFGHGTQIEKHRNISDNDAQQGICLGFATDGYIALFPDYYGIGKGEGSHLYQHSWTEAMAYIYMLKAAEELREITGNKTNGQLFLTGYSQGGHSSMAAHKYLEEMNDPRFKVTASSPMSGAYDMTGEQEKFMFQVYPRPFYLPYLLISYQEAYGIMDIKNIYDIFRPPYDTLLQAYFKNNLTLSMDALDKIMPKIPKDVLKEEITEDYVNNPNHEFRCRLEENNLTCWIPKAPIQLCFCKGDREVNYKNSEVAYNTMTALGAKNVKLNNLSDRLDHNTCAAFAVLSTKYFFNRFKKHGDNPKMKDVPAFKRFLVGFVKRKTEKQYIKDGSDHAYY